MTGVTRAPSSRNHEVLRPSADSPRPQEVKFEGVASRSEQGTIQFQNVIGVKIFEQTRHSKNILIISVSCNFLGHPRRAITRCSGRLADSPRPQEVKFEGVASRSEQGTIQFQNVIGVKIFEQTRYSKNILIISVSCNFAMSPANSSSPAVPKTKISRKP